METKRGIWIAHLWTGDEFEVKMNRKWMKWVEKKKGGKEEKESKEIDHLV